MATEPTNKYQAIEDLIKIWKHKNKVKTAFIPSPWGKGAVFQDFYYFFVFRNKTKMTLAELSNMFVAEAYRKGYKYEPREIYPAIYLYVIFPDFHKEVPQVVRDSLMPAFVQDNRIVKGQADKECYVIKPKKFRNYALRPKDFQRQDQAEVDDRRTERIKKREALLKDILNEAISDRAIKMKDVIPVYLNTTTWTDTVSMDVEDLMDDVVDQIQREWTEFKKDKRNGNHQYQKALAEERKRIDMSKIEWNAYTDDEERAKALDEHMIPKIARRLKD